MSILVVSLGGIGLCVSMAFVMDAVANHFFRIPGLEGGAGPEAFASDALHQPS